jgi:hypothetical protein
MSGLTDIPGVEIHGKGVRDFTLPVGYVDLEGKVHDQIILKEMTGAEDDMMGNEDLPVGDRVSSVLCACTEKLGDIADKPLLKKIIMDDLDGGLAITEQDRLAAMIFLRRLSIGDILKFERRCPRCGQMAENRKTDLRELKIEKSPHPERRRVKVKLPKSGKECIIKVMTAKSSVAIGRLRPTQKDLKSLALLAHIETLDGKTLDNPKAGLDAVKALPQKDRNFIRQVYNAMEAFVETDIEVDCRNPVCGTTWEFTLDVGQGFFLDLEEKVSAEDLNWL